MELIAYIKSMTEYRIWGWNLSTISFLATVAFTFGLQLPGLISQARKIWKNHSAEGIETITFITFFTYFVVFFVFALSGRSAAGIINCAVLIIPQVWIVAGVLKFKQFRIVDAIVALLGISLFIISLISANKEIFYIIASATVFLGLLLQPITMIKTKTSTNISLSFPLNFAIVTGVWTIYAFAIKNWAIAGSSLGFELIYISMVVLWFHYRRHAIKPASA